MLRLSAFVLRGFSSAFLVSPGRKDERLPRLFPSIPYSEYFFNPAIVFTPVHKSPNVFLLLFFF